MHHPAREPLNPREGWHMGSGIVTRRHHHIIEPTIDVIGVIMSLPPTSYFVGQCALTLCMLIPFPINDLVIFQVLHRDGEVVSGLVVDDVPHHRAELDVLLDVFLGPTALEIVKEHLPENCLYFGLDLLRGTLVEMRV